MHPGSFDLIQAKIRSTVARLSKSFKIASMLMCSLCTAQRCNISLVNADLYHKQMLFDDGSSSKSKDV